MNIPFVLHGASDLNEQFRKIFTANYECNHLWASMGEQVEGSPCLFHPCGLHCAQDDLDLWVMGTPCPPFSDQNPSRNKKLSVESHKLYPVTFTDALNALKLGHRAYIMEQVMGFDKPYDPSTEETPLQRFLVMMSRETVRTCFS